MVSKNLFLVVLALILYLPALYGQRARTAFGKNRIQHKEFEWRFYSSENFDVYYYDESAELSQDMLNYLEDEFDRITDFLGYYPYSKTKIFLYNSITDLQQSNIGVSSTKYNIGGQTNFIKSHIEIAHPGTIAGLKEEALLEVTRLFINEMMFGGSLTDMFQSSYLLNLPEWFTEGASYYVAKGWSIEMDDFMRDIISTKHVDKLNQYTGEEANLIGQSFWNFIGENYGRSNISNILNLTRIIRNEEKSIANTLGLPFKQVIVEWQNYYASMAAQVKNNYVLPDEENRIIERNRRGYKYPHISFSPDGNKLAYVENYKGRYEIKIKDIISNKELKVLTGGYKVINQKVDERVPLIRWADDNTLGIIEMQEAEPVLWLYDLTTKTKIPKNLRRFNQVHSFDFSGNGRLAILSADLRGQNDLYLVSIRRERVKRLTNDLFDDIQPRFIPNTNIIAFSSNRSTDSLNAEVNELNKVDLENYNLFYYDLDTTRNQVVRITNTISKDMYPTAASKYELYYISDQKGIYNIFKYDVEDSLYIQLSNYGLSIEDYDISFSTGAIAFVMQDEYKDYIYYQPEFNFTKNNFTFQTRRQQVLQAKIVSERRAARSLEGRSNPLSVNVEETEDEDTIEEITGKKQEPRDIIDTDNYVFDSEVNDDPTTSDVSFLMRYRKLQAEPKIMGPFPYETRFSADNLVTSWVIDPIRGFGILLETQMNDMLENHRIYGGVMATTDLRSGDIFAEYQYLKEQIDYSIRLDRNVIYWNTENAIQRYTLNKLEVGGSLPLTVKSRIAIKPFYAFSIYENLDPNIIIPPLPPQSQSRSLVNYAGIRGELVYDNSIVHGLNLIEGLRGKISFKHYEGLGDRDKSFSNVSLDVRNYQKIHRELVFATRLFYGRFFGPSIQNYLLGGMDNWLFNKSNTGGVNNPINVRGNNSEILFMEYVTSLRGFDYATLFGSNAVLFNAELRFPVIKYFYRGPISSNFFRNLQFIGFYDVGSSWSGSSPLSTENSVNTEAIKKGAFQAEIKNFRNPWLQSYGVGLRTVLLGYYMKFDLAWPIEDYDVKDPRLHVTLGLDF